MEPSQAILLYFVFASLVFSLSQMSMLRFLLFVISFFSSLFIESKGFFISLFIATTFLFIKGFKSLRSLLFILFPHNTKQDIKYLAKNFLRKEPFKWDKY